MLLTLSTTYVPATDLGYLLHKNPARVQSFPLAFGQAHIFYPIATAQICTIAMLLDIDPIGLVRNRRGPAGDGGLLEQYVNDRPYVASSFLSVAIAQVFGSALSGRSKDRPELVEMPMPFEAKIVVLPCRGGEGFLRRLFEPLGYTIEAKRHPLDEIFPDWGPSPYFTVQLRGICRLYDLLSHLYVLIPVLDDEKHYWVEQAEVEKLLKHGEGWLSTHPEKEEITRRYLKRQGRLVKSALARLTEEEGGDTEEVVNTAEEQLEERISLNDQRLKAVLTALKESGARRVLDLGCGEGKLLRSLCEDRQFSEILGMDVSTRALEIAEQRLTRAHCFDIPDRLKLIQGSLMYRDQRLHGFDAATVVEVVEHLDPPRLAAFERVLFEFAQPGTVVLTTPNAEYNVRFPGLPAGKFRHKDHRFEWPRAEFQNWAEGIAKRFGYSVRFVGVGEEDAQVGTPTQMGLFTRTK